jgi:uncharacterized membrane protein YfcA
MFEAIIILIFALIGVITQRIVGFGIAPFLAPVLLIFYEPAVAVVTTILVGTLSCLIILFRSRHNFMVIPKIVLNIVLGAIPGLVIGAYIVTRVDKAPLQIVTGMVVISAVLIQEYVMPKPTRTLHDTKWSGVSGFTSGLLNATAANGAPPMALWMRTHIVTPEQIRQNLAAMFIFVNTCSLTTIYLMDSASFNTQVFNTFALIVPSVIAGNYIGSYLNTRINIKLYEKLITATIMLTGAVSIALGLEKLL